MILVVYEVHLCLEKKTFADVSWMSGRNFPTKKIFRGRRYRRNKWLFPTEFRLFRGTENSRNSVSNCSKEDKNARDYIPWSRNKSKLSKFFIRLQLVLSQTWACLFYSCLCHSWTWMFYCILFCPWTCVFYSKLSFGIDSAVSLGTPRYEYSFFRRITETVLSLFRGTVLDRNSVSNPSWLDDTIVQNVTKTRQHEKNGAFFVQYLLIYKIPIPRAEHLG